MRLLSTIAAVAAIAGAGTALAQPGPGGGGQGGGQGGGVRAACAADMQKFCPDAQGPARRECMQSHQNDLSDQCKAALAQMRARMQQNGGQGGPPAGGGGPPPGQ